MDEGHDRCATHCSLGQQGEQMMIGFEEDSRAAKGRCVNFDDNITVMLHCELQLLVFMEGLGTFDNYHIMGPMYTFRDWAVLDRDFERAVEDDGLHSAGTAHARQRCSGLCWICLGNSATKIYDIQLMRPMRVHEDGCAEALRLWYWCDDVGCGVVALEMSVFGTHWMPSIPDSQGMELWRRIT